MLDVLTCPKCDCQLRRSAAMTAGVAVQCPRCDHVFPAPDDDGSAPSAVTANPQHAPPPRRALDLGGPDRPREPTFGPFWRVDLGRWLNAASTHWTAVMGPFIGVYAIAGLLLVPMVLAAALLPIMAMWNFGPWGVGQPNLEAHRQYQFLTLIVFNPLIGLLGQLMLSGTVWIAIRQLMRQPWAFSDAFRGFGKAPTVFGWWLIHQAVAMASSAPLLMLLLTEANQGPFGGIPLEKMLGPYAFWAACMLVYVVFSIRWSFTLCLVFDQDMPLFTAMATSWRMTCGHFWGLLGVYIVLGLLAAVGYIACLVGLLFAGSYVTLAHAAAYLDATRGRPVRHED